MKNRKIGIMASMLLVFVMIGTTALAATSNQSYQNTNSSYYYYLTNCGTTSMTAIGGSATVTQAISTDTTRKGVRCYITITNLATGYYYSNNSPATIKQGEVYAYEYVRNMGRRDVTTHKVEKYSGATATGTIVDTLTTKVTNFY